MPSKFSASRSALLARLRRRIESESWPRLQMMVIVALTGGVGLVASFALLHAGVDSMALRYPLALGFSYLVFLGLLWLWLHTRAEDYIDAPDVSSSLPADGSGVPSFAGQGGDFGGGGASGSFDDTSSNGFIDSDALPTVVREAGSAVDADELAIPLVALALFLGMALASFYIVYAAPVLFAELLLDGVLACSLYRHLKAADSPHWLATACRRTVLPFALTALFLGVTGFAMSVYAPDARSVGDVIAYASAR
jgi:hypothetical protein